MYLEGFYKLDSRAWMRAWNHYWNPFGNWHEPMPWPLKKIRAAPEWVQKREFLLWLWWVFRNPIHNFAHFWIGITPCGPRYTWISPAALGWIRDGDCWRRAVDGRRVCAWYFTLFGQRGHIGWVARGAFTISLGSYAVRAILIAAALAIFFSINS